MNITTLKASPHFLKATLELIERSFHYQAPHHFSEDFFPLMKESNHHNNFIMVEEEKVIAHIGVCENEILGVTIAMLGGIAVDESRRGEGIFQSLILEVMSEKRSEVAFFMLWSDQENLYKKYGFSLCGTQYEIPLKGKESDFLKTKLHLLSEQEILQLSELYQRSFADSFVTPLRDTKEWQELSHITSADLFIKTTDERISDYFFMNKGQDLTDVIYEYASEKPLHLLINSIRAYGKVWTALPLKEATEAQYQFFLAPGDSRLFSEFIKIYTNGKMIIREINQAKQEVYFYFNDELISLEVEEFLRGVLGPGIFEELENDVKPIFISGLISI